MITSNCPVANSSKIIRRSFALVEPVNKAIRTSKGSNNWLKLSICCSARISVGIINADWYPALAAANNAIAATIVFPLPTSPCNNRCICLASFKSLQISLTTLFWAIVNSKGSVFIKRRKSATSYLICVPCPLAVCFFRKLCNLS